MCCGGTSGFGPGLGFQGFRRKARVPLRGPIGTAAGCQGKPRGRRAGPRSPPRTRARATGSVPSEHKRRGARNPLRPIGGLTAGSARPHCRCLALTQGSSGSTGTTSAPSSLGTAPNPQGQGQGGHGQEMSSNTKRMFVGPVPGTDNRMGHCCSGAELGAVAEIPRPFVPRAAGEGHQAIPPHPHREPSMTRGNHEAKGVWPRGASASKHSQGKRKPKHGTPHTRHDPDSVSCE